MTHRHLPPKYQLRLRRVLGATYATVAAGGLAVLIFTPRTVEGSLGIGLTVVWACMVLAGGGIGLWATITDRWRVERWSTWLAIGGATIYAGFLFAATAHISVGRLGPALIAAAAALLLTYRAVEVDAKARADRDEHDAITGR